MRGCYILLIKLEEPKTIKVGSLGEIEFKAGFYAYIGSGMNNVMKRVERHFKKDKKLRWHIDYLTVQADELHALIIPTDVKIECEIAKVFSANFDCIEGFGCSDCKCRSHLFYLGFGEFE